MSKTQLQTNNTRLASLIDELKGKAAGGSGGGTVDNGIIQGMSTMVLEPTQTIYYNLEDIANFSSKKFIVLFGGNALDMGMMHNLIILSRSNVSENFSMLYRFEYQNFEIYVATITENILAIECSSPPTELNYYAI